MSKTMDQPQYMVALARANASRLEHVAVKRALAAHELSVEAALVDPRAQSMSVYALLTAQWRWGEHRTMRLLARVGELLWGHGAVPMAPLKLVGRLSDRERAAIVQACKGREQRS